MSGPATTGTAARALTSHPPLRPRFGRVACRLLVVTATLFATSCKEEPLKVRSLQFDGVGHVPVAELRAALATKQGGWLPFTRKPGFSREEFAKDLKRIEAFYADRGYPSARVTNVDVDLDDRKQQVAITVHVKEGEPVRIAQVHVTGLELLPARRQARVMRTLGLTAGAVRRRSAVSAARETVVSELKEHGFPYAKVDVREEPAETPQGVLLVIAAQPGQRATFGPIDVQGNSTVSSELIARQLTFEPGDLFRASRVQESQRRLSRLPLFDFAYVEPRPGELQPAELPVRVTVVEGKPRRFTAAAGYGTEDKVRVQSQWEHVNFFGGARTAGIEGRFSALDRGVRLAFGQPDFPVRHVTFSAEGNAWREAEPTFDRNTFGGRATLRWERDRRGRDGRRGGATSVGVTFIDELEDFKVSESALADPAFRDELIGLGLDPDTGAGRGTVVALRLEAERRTAPNPLDSSRGYVVSGAVERAGGFLPSTYTYTEMTAQVRHYLSITRRIVAAQRVRVATIDAPAPTDASVPFFKRYFLGGSSSLRGWGRFDVSPLTTSGQPLGGLSLLEASSELRVAVAPKLRLVAFVDAGNVWAQPWRFGPEGVRVDVGPGLRYDTPIGPARLDFGYQLNPIDGLVIDGKPESRHWRVHLSIGQAF